MNVIAFGASNKRESINQKLAVYCAKFIPDSSLNILNLADIHLPIYSEDIEKAEGIPAAAHDFYRELNTADVIIIGLAEHNGTYTAAYKNLFDWVSRIEMKMFGGKKLIYVATSPGPGGAASVLNQATQSAPYFDANLIASISLPSFYDKFDAQTGVITDENFNQALEKAIHQL